MAAEKYNFTLCQGSDFALAMDLSEDSSGFGRDLSSAVIRMQIRAPDVEGNPPVLSIDSTGSTPLGSTIAILDPEVIAPTAISDFGAGGEVEVPGAGFQVEELAIADYDEETGEPLELETVTRNVANVGDIARVAGSTSNDGDYRIAEITDADTIGVLPEPTEEAGAGTLTVIRYGRFEVRITSAESAAFDWEFADYDLEVEEAGISRRYIEGRITLSPEVTR